MLEKAKRESSREARILNETFKLLISEPDESKATKKTDYEEIEMDQASEVVEPYGSDVEVSSEDEETREHYNGFYIGKTTLKRVVKDCLRGGA